ncbi:MAG: hypothetical protein C4526_06410 [Nitrospiraceae bacterium]|nr:MAG: hypothetical protein C4526_06410 [Nitrospiraceae bacterium]
MRIALNYRQKNERLEEALKDLGHTVVDDTWDIRKIISDRIDAVIFEFKYILKNEIKFLKLSYGLKKTGIPRVTWCVDIPNIGARKWKLSLLLKADLIDIFATHSMQDLPGPTDSIIYLPNAAWLKRYNPGNVTLEELRNPGKYTTDVSFIGNMDSAKYPEHLRRARFLDALGVMLRQNGISYRFEDGRHLDVSAQVDIIQRSRININFGCGADRYENKSWGLPERCYGIPACGGFLLSEERAHAKDDFIEGEEIVLFRDLKDCFEKIRYYITSHDEARRIAENAYRRVMNEHTYRHRAEKLMGSIMKLKK